MKLFSDNTVTVIIRDIKSSYNLDMFSIFNFAFIVAVAIVLRILSISPVRKKKNIRPTRKSTDTCTVAVFLGTGGHTSEALTLISALDWTRYTRRIYFVNDGDSLSTQKACDLERKRSSDKGQFNVIVIPRARQVHQPLLSTIRSALYSLAICLHHFTLQPLLHSQGQLLADVLILNGPGTCFVMCLAVYVNKFLGLKAPLIIYIESFARVKSLSLTGKLIKHFADYFITQWPNQPSAAMLQSKQWLV